MLLALAAGCQRDSTQTGPPLDGLATLIPRDAIAIAVVDVTKLRETAWLAQLDLSHMLPSSIPGINLEKDVDRIAVASDGHHTLVAFSGRFSGFQPASPGAGIEAAKLDDSRVVAGPESLVKQASERAKSQDGLPAQLATLAARIPANSQVWATAAGGFRLAFPDQANWRNLNRVLSSVESIRTWLDISTGFRWEAAADCGSDAGAEKTVRQWKGLISLGRLAAVKRRDLPGALALINVSSQGSIVSAKADLSTAQVTELLTAARGRAGN